MFERGTRVRVVKDAPALNVHPDGTVWIINLQGWTGIVLGEDDDATERRLLVQFDNGDIYGLPPSDLAPEETQA